jgi:hypothetical protein
MDYEFTVKHKGKEYDVEADIRFFTEHYGDDADGNRGISYDTWEYNQLIIKDMAGKEVEGDLFNQIEDVVDDYVSDHYAD